MKPWHDPAFTGSVKRSYMASLSRIRWPYAEAADLAEKLNLPRPSEMNQRQRNAFLRWLAELRGSVQHIRELETREVACPTS